MLATTVPGGDAHAERTPATIGRFSIQRRLGAGAMGAVYLATDPALERPLAVKVLHDGDGEHAGARRRMLREAQATAQLVHRNVVVVHEVGVHDDRIYIAMEYIAGTTLKGWQAGRGWREILAMYQRAGQGLQAAHDAGLVHRDFKPDNVLVGDDGRVRVTDFGLVAALDGAALDMSDETAGLRARLDLAASMTRTGAILGTPRYMAPEQHLGQPVDARADQFAFCVALYEAWFHQPPFAGHTYDLMVARVLAGDVLPVPPGADVPVALRDAVLRGLRRDREQRFPSMTELLAALTAPPAAPSPPSARRRWPWGAAALGSVVGGAAIAVVAMWPTPAARPTPARAAVQRAKACDCELVDLVMPAGATISGVHNIDGIPSTIVWQATGQLALPRGHHVIDYRVDGSSYSYGVVSEGAGSARTVTLPTPEHRAGFVFVPGGTVLVTDSDGTQDVPRELAPYLLAVQAEPAPATYADALARTVEAHARLPTAAEWEWAARLGHLEDTFGAWEWTGTRYSSYASEYIDDALGEGPIVVHGGRDECPGLGGGRVPCDPVSHRAELLAGGVASSSTDLAEVRLARSARSVAPTREVIADIGDLVGVRRFIVDWRQLEAPPSLQVAESEADRGACYVTEELVRLGVAKERIEVVAEALDRRVILRWNPNPDFVGRAPPVCDPTAADLLRRAQSAAASNQYGRALMFTERALGMRGIDVALRAKAVTLAGLASCNTKDARKARIYYDRSPPGRQTLLRQACLKQGIELLQ